MAKLLKISSLEKRVLDQFFIGLANRFNKLSHRKLYDLMEFARDGKVNELKAALAANPALGRGFDQNGMSALMWAAEAGQAACVKLLLPLSDPLAVDAYGSSALFLAAKCERSRPFYRPGQEPKVYFWSLNWLQSATVKRSSEVIQKVMPETVATFDRAPLTAGHAECVKLLLPMSDTRAIDQSGSTALMWAACGRADCVELLLPVSDPLAVNKRKSSALMIAAERGHKTCVELLLPLSDRLAKNKYGRSAMIGAAINGHARCVELLLPVSDPLVVDDEVMSALAHASLQGHVECVELLLPVSDLSHKDKDGKTALDLARERGHDQVVLAIRRHQARLEAAELSKHIGTATVAQEHGAAAPRKPARL